MFLDYECEFEICGWAFGARAWFTKLQIKPIVVGLGFQFPMQGRSPNPGSVDLNEKSKSYGLLNIFWEALTLVKK